MGSGKWSVTPRKPLDAVVADWVSVFIKLFGGWSWNCEDMYTTCNWDTIIMSQIIVIGPDLDIQSLLVANNVACSECRTVLIQPWFSVQGSLLCLILHPALSACTDCITLTQSTTVWPLSHYETTNFTWTLVSSCDQTNATIKLSFCCSYIRCSWMT